MSYDLERIRADFPILAITAHGKPLTFLDSGASAQKPEAVIEAEAAFYRSGYANIHRGVYKLSQDATEAYEQVRERIAAFLNARHASECIFVRGATEGINLVAQSYGRAFLKPGDTILVSELEHHSNIVPWQMLRDERGLNLKVIPVTDHGRIDMDGYRALLAEGAAIVAIAHVTNSIGTVYPVKEMIALAHAAGAAVLVDGCQAAPRMTVDVRDLDADFYVFSGHKLYGPTGVGVLYGKRQHLEKMPPWQGGGDMIETVTFEKTTYNVPPQKFEAGTPNIAGVIALGAALDYVTAIGLGEIAEHEAELLEYATERLRKINSLRIICDGAPRAGILSFVMNGAHPHDIATVLDREGICIRAGHHCAQPALARFGVTATARASFGIYNGKDDIDRLVAALNKVATIFA